MKETTGFGKVILFGEHFVVYGIPAIAAAIGAKTTAKVEEYDGQGVIINDQRPATPGYKEEKLGQQKQSLGFILKVMGIDPSHPLKITLGGDLVAASGIGASAASCVAIARVLAEHLGKEMTDEEINNIAYEGEKGYHGTPSGIDNSVSTFGGLIWFQKGQPEQPNVIEKMKLREPLEIIMADTGLTTDTAKAVQGVRERKEAEPEKYGKLFKEAEQVARDARKALESFDLQEVGQLMGKNHKLLQEIGVSCEELDHLVKLALDNGAVGAKMTGSGLGGNIVALTPGKELQEKVTRAIEAEGFKVLRTRIGV